MTLPMQSKSNCVNERREISFFFSCIHGYNFFDRKGRQMAEKRKETGGDAQAFTTREFIETLLKINPEYGERKAYRTLQHLQEQGRITKVSRGHYTFKISRRVYRYRASSLMKSVRRKIEAAFPKCEFQIFELQQFNEFLQHPLDYNAVFVETIHGYEEKVSDLLRSGDVLVMRDPDYTRFQRYRTDEVIVVCRLITDSPAPCPASKTASLEKLLVDLFSKKLTGRLIDRGEYRHLFEEAFSRYSINEKSMFRYARRRSQEKEIVSFIAEETLIHLMI